MKVVKGKGEKLEKRLLNKLWDGTKVYVINGRYVRDNYDNDFLMGGHGYVYKYIPKGEIWIEDEIIFEEEPEMLAHELFEWYLMKYRKRNYKQAHRLATDFEKTLRDVRKIRKGKLQSTDMWNKG